MSMPATAVQPDVKKHLTSSILLRMRTGQPRQTGTDHGKGPHSGIISATRGLEEYRQIHLTEHNPGAYEDEINVSAASCSTPARRTRPAGTTSQARARRSVPASWSVCAARTGPARVSSGSSSRSSSPPALAGTGVLKALTYGKNGDIVPHDQG
ncbi:hypothetical protein AB0O75_20620 [Streptomyces sp. NPDC088921]|uniref:hypothetical protein n=1 Tax=unclassified Streptomyces TaxID=2593676 RepID=UPI0034231255